MTPSVARADAARTLATRLKKRWRKGAEPDAAAALVEYPELRRHKSVVLELAYEEYLLREEAGAAPTAGSFAARFPSFRAGVLSVLAAHQFALDRPDRFAPVPDAGWPVPGAVVGGVKLLRELGRGGFGRVYLGFDARINRLRVLKLTTGRSAEARVIGGLDHPHVTDVCWADEADGRTAVCMPLLGVATLADVIAAAFLPDAPPPATADVIVTTAEADALVGEAARPAPPAVRAGEPYAVGAAAVAARVAGALAHLHSKGVAHGDVKPSNVVVGQGGAPYLIDFNLSSRESGPATARGTPGYMAPELLDAAADPLAAAVDLMRADVYAVGVVVFELLTGRTPFPVADPTAFASQAAAARAPLPAFPASVPAGVAPVLAACLSADPAARPSAAALAEVLDQFVTDARTPPAPAPAARRTRWRVAAAVGSVALAAAVVGALGNGRLTPSVEGPPPREVVPLPPVLGIVPDRSRPPVTAEEYFDRGWRAMKAEDWKGAREDFLWSNKLVSNPWAVALTAYCETENRMHAASIGYAGSLIDTGTATPDVLNNIGYALVQLRKADEALVVLDRCLAIEPRHPAARFNRAFALFKKASAGPVDVRAVEDLNVALGAGLGLGTCDGHFTAAQILAGCSVSDPTQRAAARAHLRAAVAAGKPATDCRTDHLLRTRLATGFGAALMFEAACAGPQGISPGTTSTFRLVEPRPF